VIIGVALGDVVKSLVNDIIMPPVGVALGGCRLLRPGHQAQGRQRVDRGGQARARGPTSATARFINLVIAFIVVALVVYAIASLLLREEPAPPTKTCPFCKEEVPVAATKCRACTSSI